MKGIPRLPDLRLPGEDVVAPQAAREAGEDGEEPVGDRDMPGLPVLCLQGLRRDYTDQELRVGNPMIPGSNPGPATKHYKGLCQAHAPLYYLLCPNCAKENPPRKLPGILWCSPMSVFPRKPPMDGDFRMEYDRGD